jgi:hypothetical protein
MILLNKKINLKKKETKRKQNNLLYIREELDRD